MTHMMLSAVERAVRQTGDTLFSWPPVNLGLLAGALFGTVSALLGVEGEVLFRHCIVVMGADLLAGLLVALILPHHEVEWPVFLGGALGKILMFLALPVAHAMDATLALTPVVSDPDQNALVVAVLVGILAHESASILQNIFKVKKDLRRLFRPLTRVLDALSDRQDPPRTGGRKDPASRKDFTR